MSVFKRNGKGNYYIQFNYRGKVYIKSSRSTNKATAARMEREWRTEIHAREELGELPDITLEKAMEACISSKPNPETRRYYKQHTAAIRSHFDVSCCLSEVRDWSLSKFKAERLKEGVSEATIKHDLNVLKAAFRWAEENGFNCPQLRWPTAKPSKSRLRYLSLTEEVRLLKELDPTRPIKGRPPYERRSYEERESMQDNYDLVVLLLDTGARYGEIANIQWDSIDMNSSQIRLWRPKVRNESVLFMTDRVKAVLSRRYDQRNSKYVFANRSGGPRGHQTAGIRNAFKRAGLAGFRVHDLRHTCASRLIQNGMSLYEVSKILGHTSVQTTQRYAHIEMVDVSRKARDIMNTL
ncbi:site-specific integrase [Alloalcanivorax xenomutans]|jgi:integrase|uniref:tyrosine-type recombinase/integrase n=1 Tax=Alloalcanivorax xenomutans TaxID=1094342 RepID=UPI000E265859